MFVVAPKGAVVNKYRGRVLLQAAKHMLRKEGSAEEEAEVPKVTRLEFILAGGS